MATAQPEKPNYILIAIIAIAAIALLVFLGLTTYDRYFVTSDISVEIVDEVADYDVVLVDEYTLDKYLLEMDLSSGIWINSSSDDRVRVDLTGITVRVTDTPLTTHIYEQLDGSGETIVEINGTNRPDGTIFVEVYLSDYVLSQEDKDKWLDANILQGIQMQANIYGQVEEKGFGIVKSYYERGDSIYKLE